MAKPKTPFFSLEAHGSVGQAVTAQRLAHVNILRRKPHPAYRYTLPQAYQRWLYEDYAYLWTQQSAATQAEYRSGGSRFHLTGFQYWMKVMLLTMPDIAAWYKLDEKSGVICHDSGAQGNHGAFVGPIPVNAWIDGGYFFDGLNDRILIPTTPTLDVLGDLTIEFLFYLWDTTRVQTIFAKGGVNIDWVSVHVSGLERPDFFTDSGGIRASTLGANGDIPYLETHHWCVTLNAGFATIYLDAEDITVIHGNHIDRNPTALPTYIGVRDILDYWTKGVIDNFIFYNRALDLTEIQRHSLRRYPA